MSGEPQLFERRQLSLRLLGRPRMEDDERRQLVARAVRRVHEPGEDGQVVRNRRERVPVEPEQVACGLDRMRDQPAGDHLQRVQSIFQRCGDAEVAAAATQGPEQIRARVRRHVEDVAVGGHQLDRGQVVGREPVLRHQPAQAAAQRQPGDAGRRDRAARDGEPVGRSLAIQLAPQHAALRAHGTRARVDVDPLHRRQVDHQRAVDHGAAGNVVTAAAHADLEALGAREPHGV